MRLTTWLLILAAAPLPGVILALADRWGNVDVTLDYLALVTGASRADVAVCMERFMAPDPASRSKTLEGRRLLSASLSGGQLLVTGTDYSDVINVTRVVTADHVKVKVTEQRVGSATVKTSYFNSPDVTSIKVDANNGNDKVTIGTTLTKPTTIIGSNGNDTLIGGGGRDAIRKSLAELGPMKGSEMKLLAISLTLLAFWATEGVLHRLDTSTTTVTAVALMFLPGLRIMTWKEAQPKIPWGTVVLFGIGISLVAAGAALTMLVHVTLGLSVLGLSLPQVLVTLGGGMLIPASVAGVVMPNAHRAGLAAGLMGFAQMLGATCSGLLLGALQDGSAWPMIGLQGAFALGAFSLFNLMTRKARRATAPAAGLRLDTPPATPE